MAKKSGNSFGNFTKKELFVHRGVKPIQAEFSKGSIPDSIYSSNREAAWTRWRRGYELATADTLHLAYDYPFTYEVPLPPGVTVSSGNNPSIPGIFKGFPTTNKEFSMHWAGVRVAGSLRLDNIFDYLGTRASILSVTEDSTYWYVQLAGSWSVSTPLPPPLYVPIPGVPGGLKPINGEILEDRIVQAGGDPITRETIDPATQTRYGYIHAVLADVGPFNGILKLKKQGSVQATPDATLVTPARTAPTPGRFLITGTRYCCSCQDFNRREYMFINSLNKDTISQRAFPRVSISTVKPGRKEIMTSNGQVDNRAMTPITQNRDMEILSPATEYNVPPSITPTTSTVPGTTRDNPGVYRDFGAIYVRNTSDPSLEGAKAEGMPLFGDYSTTQGELTSLEDYWTPLLDEMRYCKHIYAMKFMENVFPPEPSDLPVETGTSITEWEQNFTEKVRKEIRKADYRVAIEGLSMMDLPPYNCQAPMMMPVMQKLFNLPSTYVKMENFTMYDKEGNPYKPSENQLPAS